MFGVPFRCLLKPRFGISLALLLLSTLGACGADSGKAGGLEGAGDGERCETTANCLSGYMCMEHFCLVDLSDPAHSSSVDPGQSTCPEGMSAVPAGAFLMGCNEAIDCHCASIETPYHLVRLDGYAVDIYEVTNSEYAAFLNWLEGQASSNTCEVDNQEYDCVKSGDSDLQIQHQADGWVVTPGMEDKPVVEVSWFGAVAYCNWKKKRLPTEAEWEKAARGTDGRLFPWGNEVPTCERVVMDDGEGGCGLLGPDVVGSRSPKGDSPFGAADMAGNVWEWTADWADETYYLRSPEENPRGPAAGTARVVRGSCYGDETLDGYEFRTSRRHAVNPLGGAAVGFRCVTPTPLTQAEQESRGIWTDDASDLTWQVEPTGGTMEWSKAEVHCSELTLDGGEWHLPTIGELRTLIRGCPAVGARGSCGVGDDCLESTCFDSEDCSLCSTDDCLWPDDVQGPCEAYWSSSGVADVVYLNWYIDFKYGDISHLPLNSELTVRCVR